MELFLYSSKKENGVVNVQRYQSHDNIIISYFLLKETLYSKATPWDH